MRHQIKDHFSSRLEAFIPVLAVLNVGQYHFDVLVAEAGTAPSWYFLNRWHSGGGGVMVSTIASQQEGPRFEPGAFLCPFSPCADPTYSPTTCIWRFP